MENKIEFINEFRKFPDRVTIELTNKCNLACNCCPRKFMTASLGFMDKEVFEKIVDECAEHLPVALVPFFRGESLLHNHFNDFIRYAKTKGLGPIQFTTNATLLNEKMNERILSSGIDFISFSLDTLDKESYEKNRLGADFDTVVSNVLHFIAEKEKLNSKLQIQVSTVDHKYYSSFQQKFIEYWRNKVDFVRIYDVHSLKGKFGSTEKGNFVSKRLPCKKLFTDMVIYWNGDVAICNHDWNRMTKLGNITSKKLYDIYNSKAYDSIRKHHISGDLSGEALCYDCCHWQEYYLPEKLVGKMFLAKEVKTEY